MSVEPYVLPAIDSQTAEHLDLIATRLAAGEFALGSSALRFKLAPVSGPTRKLSDPFQLTLEWGGGQLHLIAGRAMLPLLYAHRFPQAQVDVLPEDLALAALQLSLGELTAQLEELSGRRVRFTRAGAADARSLLATPFRFSVSLDSEPARDGLEGIIAADAAGLGLLALLARRRPAQKRSIDPDTPMPLRLEIGEMRIALSALKAVAVNDVLMPDSEIDAAAPIVYLRADSRYAARAKLDEQSLVVDSVLQEKHEVKPSSETTTGTAPATLDALEIRLGFELGEKILTLGELAALQPGQVLALDVPLPQLVGIRANGSLIGRGELVKLAGRVAVRVTELAVSIQATDGGDRS
ncbi:type III secretion system cytoplasmic ring protein SctQ [Peristeroidobacter soli]|uniref:type III secretion system cytoplasmic ring protein SctQ n=1 Tax=Peristeroidobacter soli TaxID=2497877 RepID=UPI00101BE7D8|nr:type III secretion system cytoplasmic ring protein SctQ [Peristeroidobacter soli]